MNKQAVSIKYDFASLNALINKASRHWGYRHKWTNDMKDFFVPLFQECLKPVRKYPVRLTFHWYFDNKRNRDLSNMGGCVKALEDCLRYAGVLTDDSWQYVNAIDQHIFIDGWCGVMIFIEEGNKCIAGT